MQRKIYSQLVDWKQSSNGKSALLIEGARRIGKSYIVEEFARNEYESYLIIDFNHTEAAVLSFFEDYATRLDMLFQMLSIHYGVELVERRSLIVFDEVQQFPPARALIKYLVADGRYDYIETGSLISIHKNVKNIVIPSEEQHLAMYPMDFEEFLWATGNGKMMAYIKDCCTTQTPLGPLHRKAMDLFRLYMLLGGMPQVIQTYIDTHDFRQTEKIKQNILALYRDDIHKYATGAEAKAADIFEAIPSQLQKQGTRFVLADINANARYVHYESAFFWLRDSRIVNICYNTFAPNIGLGMNTERTTLKCYMADTGLFLSLAFDEQGSMPAEVYERILHGKLEVNLGYVMENMVAQMLQAAGHKLYYFYQYDDKDSGNTMEIDFLVSKHSVTSRKNICPIEVKSSPRYALSSLKKCIAKFSQYVTRPVVLHTKDLEIKDDILYLPVYMTGLL